LIVCQKEIRMERKVIIEKIHHYQKTPSRMPPLGII
jgi:hypothetical protein